MGSNGIYGARLCLRVFPSCSPVQPRAARPKAPPVSPMVFTPMGPSDLMSAFLRNRIVFVGSTINSQMAQRVISQLIALAAIDEDEDIKVRNSIVGDLIVRYAFIASIYYNTYSLCAEFTTGVHTATHASCVLCGCT